MAQNPFLSNGAAPSSPTTQPATGGGNPFLGGGGGEYTPPPTSVAEPPTDYGKAGVGAMLLAGLAGVALRKNPNAVLKPISKGLQYANAARQQLMLSGFAAPKSALGNMGSAAEMAYETKSLRPLKEMLSMQTVKDAYAAYKGHAGHNPLGVTIPYLPTPGRVMGAMDTAAQGALRRAGATAADAERRVLQAPLQGDLAQALDSPLAQYVHPFRRTPFNQFIEGHKTISRGFKGDKTAAVGALASGATGAMHGAATADDDIPMSIPLALSALPQYGVSYGYGALLGRYMGGGKIPGSSIAGSLLPVSEYGVEGALDPMRPFEKPAYLTALERMAGR